MSKKKKKQIQKQEVLTLREEFKAILGDNYRRFELMIVTKLYEATRPEDKDMLWTVIINLLE